MDRLSLFGCAPGSRPTLPPVLALIGFLTRVSGRWTLGCHRPEVDSASPSVFLEQVEDPRVVILHRVALGGHRLSNSTVEVGRPFGLRWFLTLYKSQRLEQRSIAFGFRLPVIHSYSPPAAGGGSSASCRTRRSASAIASIWTERLLSLQMAATSISRWQTLIRCLAISAALVIVSM